MDKLLRQGLRSISRRSLAYNASQVTRDYASTASRRIHVARTWTSTGQGARRPWISRIALLTGTGAVSIYLLSNKDVVFCEAAQQPTLTNEERLLEESEKEWDELYNQVPQDRNVLYKVYRFLAIPFRVWIFEPLATAFRFVHLVVIFAPVLITIPMVFLGTASANSHDKSGAILWYRFLVHQMEMAGPTFIKLGQWAASRTDIFPDAMCELMSKLHSNVSAHPLWQTKRIIRKAFNGLPFDQIFEEFDEKPLGVGAIAQVYKAKLKSNLLPDTESAAKHMKQKRKLTPLVVQTLPQSPPSGSVAIKVLHPRVEKTVHRDLRIMKFFARILNAIPTLEWFSFPDEVDQFSEMMRLQLDLRIEGNNLSKFQENFKRRSQLTFPFPYHDYTTRSVLIEEYAHGLPLQYFLDTKSCFNSDLADTGLDAFLHMLILDNFVHADLHPGNIMVRFFKPVAQPFLQQVKEILHIDGAKTEKRLQHIMHDDEATDFIVARMKPLRHDKEAWTAELAKIAEEGFRPQLIFIDTGLVTELNTVNRRNFLDLFSAVASFDGHRAGTLMVERCRQPDAVLDAEIFALKMQHLVLNVKSQTFSLGKIRVGDILNTVLSMVREHHVRMEGDFINVVLSILLLEGIGRQLNPELDLFKSAIPFLREAGKMGVKQAAAGGDVAAPGSEGQPGLGEKLTLAKVWLGLELREMYVASTSKEQVETLVAHDIFSANV